MDRNIIDFPSANFGPVLSDWHINVRGRSTDDSVDGSSQVIYGVTPRWEVKLDYTIAKRTNAMLWSSVMARMRGRTNIMRIRLCDRNRPTSKSIGVPGAGQYSRTGIPHDDDTFFDDGVGYENTLQALVTEEVAAGSTRIPVNATMINDSLLPGNFISYDDWLYMIVGVEGSGEDTVYEIEMPLRTALAVNDPIDADASSLMVFVTDMEGRLVKTPNNRGQPSLQLVEWTRRS